MAVFAEACCPYAFDQVSWSRPAILDSSAVDILCPAVLHNLVAINS